MLVNIFRGLFLVHYMLIGNAVLNKRNISNMFSVGDGYSNRISKCQDAWYARSSVEANILRNSVKK